ncbi:MAG: hypothetical protein LBC61_05890 [Candidatus Peribacteria bacterium]|nr:hypothetical protein [Candidatus Peribacteria bacterium]
MSRFLNKISSDTSDLSNILSKEAENLDELNFSLNIDGVDIDRKNYLSQGNLLRNIYVFNSDYIDKTIRSEGFSKKIE